MGEIDWHDDEDDDVGDGDADTSSVTGKRQREEGEELDDDDEQGMSLTRRNNDCANSRMQMPNVFARDHRLPLLTILSHILQLSTD